MAHSEDNPFLLTAPLEILGVLRAVRDRQSLIRMHVPGRELAIITTILEIDKDDGTILLDNASEDAVNRQLTQAEKISFETQLDKVRVLFTTGGATTSAFEGKPALQIPLPEALTRLQRREYYRIEVPMSDKATCTLPLQVSPYSAALEIKDISSGGLSLADPLGLLSQELSTVFDHCTLALPDAPGPVTVSMKVVRCLEEKLPNGKTAYRTGCEFLSLSNPARMSIQRYISRLERKQIARQRGLE